MPNVYREINPERWFFPILAISLVFFCCTGCASITPVNLSLLPGSKTISMSSNINKEYSVIKHFKIRQNVPVLFLSRLSPYGATADISDLIEPEMLSSHADAVVNLSIKGEADIKDVFLPVGIGVLGGIVLSPVFYFFVAIPFLEDLKTYQVEGDLVTYINTKQTPRVIQPVDPNTGLPLKKPAIQYDPNTGLPIKEK
jgi:hypothetical protein